ncbi:MAG: hypothetical protein SGARI_007895, partial [Bacillariaceae sp.]
MSSDFSRGYEAKDPEDARQQASRLGSNKALLLQMSTTMADDEKSVYLVAGDIGGTNSRLGLYSTTVKDEDGMPAQLFYKEYKNQEHLTNQGGNGDDPETAFERRILAPFLKECWEDHADLLKDAELVVCLAVAGPVKDNKVTTSRHKELEISGDGILQRSNNRKRKSAGDDEAAVDPYLAAIVECQVINDFVAQGYGCLTLDHDKDVTELIEDSKEMKEKNKGGTMVCLGAGTGLGTCFLTCSNGVYTCHPSEFGQVEWAPTSGTMFR